ncbi:hypothetical protein FQR65_LT20387 [Abscondita terminalis]|nr:hypothetical protein FQR65_LT20387 [Abscondita terminalis]
MIRCLKRGKDGSSPRRRRHEGAEAPSRKSSKDVAGSAGDEAVRAVQPKFDQWTRRTFACRRPDIEAARKSQVTPCRREVETFPGVVLGHKNIRQWRGLPIPGGNIPCLLSLHMSVPDAKVAGVQAGVATAPPYQGKPHPAIVTAMVHGRRDEILVLGGRSGAVVAMAVAKHQPICSRGHARRPRQQCRSQKPSANCMPRWHRSVCRPTETLVIADDSVDAEICADRPAGPGVSMATTSPCVLLTNCETLGTVSGPELEDYGRGSSSATRCRKCWQTADELAFEHVQGTANKPTSALGSLRHAPTEVPWLQAVPAERERSDTTPNFRLDGQRRAWSRVPGRAPDSRLAVALAQAGAHCDLGAPAASATAQGLASTSHRSTATATGCGWTASELTLYCASKHAIEGMTKPCMESGEAASVSTPSARRSSDRHDRANVRRCFVSNMGGRPNRPAAASGRTEEIIGPHRVSGPAAPKPGDRSALMVDGG